MQCEDCHLASQDPPDRWLRFNPACLDCGCRYLWVLQRLQTGTEEKRERLRSTLSVWKTYGHAEKDLRDGAKRTRGEWREWARELLRDPGH